MISIHKIIFQQYAQYWPKNLTNFDPTKLKLNNLTDTALVQSLTTELRYELLIVIGS